MFNFPTELILNSLSGVSVLNDTQDPSLLASEKALLIKKAHKFRSSYVKGIYKNVGYNPVKEVSTIDLTGVTLGDLVGKVVRLNLDTRLSGSADGSYSRWAINMGRPTFAEHLVATTPASTAALATALAASFNKQLAPNADITITVSGDDLVLTAKTEYQRLDGVALLS